MFASISAFAIMIVADLPTKWDRCAQYINDHIDRSVHFVWHAFLNHPNEFVTAVASAIVALFTYMLSKSTRRLWEAGERQIEVFQQSIAASQEANRISRETMVASRRAWLTLEDVHLVAGSRFLENGMVLRVSMSAKNFGQTPAIDSWVNFEAHFTTSENPYVAAENTFKTNLKAKLSSGLGSHIIFPGDSLVLTELWEVRREQMTFDERGKGGPLYVNFIIFVGVAYKVVGDPGPHITFLPFELLNIPVGTTVSVDRKLNPHPFLAGEAT